jgi:hypothetical protein
MTTAYTYRALLQRLLFPFNPTGPWLINFVRRGKGLMDILGSHPVISLAGQEPAVYVPTFLSQGL